MLLTVAGADVTLWWRAYHTAPLLTCPAAPVSPVRGRGRSGGDT